MLPADQRSTRIRCTGSNKEVIHLPVSNVLHENIPSPLIHSRTGTRTLGSGEGPQFMHRPSL